MGWTDKQVELLVTLWSEGKSPAQIAARLVALGQDTVLEKLQLLMLHRAVRSRASARHARLLTTCRISSGQKSPRLKNMRADQARRRADAGAAAGLVPERRGPAG